MTSALRSGPSAAASVVALIVVIAATAIAACGGVGTASSSSPPNADASLQVASPPAATTSASAPSAATTPTAPRSGVQLDWEGNAQVELTSDGAPRVLIDVQGPASLAWPPTADDILLTTHEHPDHLSNDLVKQLPRHPALRPGGPHREAGRPHPGVAAAHTEGDPLLPKGGTDYIYVIDMGGLRIAHLGDIGQPALTPGQAKALGRVDVAITQFDNAQFSDVDVKNRKAFKLMQQLKPRLIVQTHSSLPAVKYAATLWPVLFSKRTGVILTPDRLPKKTSLLLLGEEGAYYVESGVHARRVDW